MRFHFYFFSLVTLAALTISATVYTRASQTQAPVAIETEPADFGHIYPQARISSPFGLRLHPVHRKESMHLGIDFALPNGTPVRAAEGGVVAQVANEAERSTYGRYLRICHADGYSSLYAHLSHIDVRVGQRVARGDTIARSGQAGDGALPHLHFEVRHHSQPIDPMQYLQRKKN